MPNQPQIFRFVLFDGFSNLVLASAMEPLRDVKNRAPKADLTWVITTLNDAPVRSSSGLLISPDEVFSPSEKCDTLIFVSGYGVRNHASAKNLSLIRQAARQAKRVVGLDAGSWLMAAAGLLENHTATIHWHDFSAFQEAFPKVNVVNQRFVKSGQMMTCGGASTALDLILDLVREQFGAVAAFEASAMFVYDPELRERLGQNSGSFKGKSSPLLLAVSDLMADNIEIPLSLADICRETSTSLRTLNRLFVRELATTPGQYYLRIRLDRARNLAWETSLSVQEIAMRCGFSSSSSLSRAFSSRFNETISAMRATQFSGGT